MLLHIPMRSWHLKLLDHELWHRRLTRKGTLHSMTSVFVQNVDGETASQGFCREEFQAFMEYFVDPLMQRLVRERYQAEKRRRNFEESLRYDAVKKTFAVVGHEQEAERQALRNAKAAAISRGWQWVETPVWYDEQKVAFTQKATATSKLPGDVPPTSYFGHDVGKSDSDSFCQIVDEWRAKLQGAYKLLVEHGTKPAPQGAWFAELHVPRSAYKPREWPYFVTYDRGTMHSWWSDTKQQKHVPRPGVPLMQIVRTPPRGHDVHQLAEHSIAPIKGHVNKVFKKARMGNHKLTTALGYRAVQDGCKRYHAGSWGKNWWKLRECLFIVGADKGTKLRLWRRMNNQTVKWQVVEGLGGDYCYQQRS